MSQETKKTTPKQRSPRRSVKAAFIEKIGPVWAHELVKESPDIWGHWRDQITDAHQGHEGLRANCAYCEHPVYIAVSRTFREGHLPLFKHYGGAPSSCPWHSNSNLSPDAVRALQYGGRQTSLLHDNLCAEVARLASLDNRCRDVQIERYLRSTKNQPGRYPDVLIEHLDGRKFAIEVQLSTSHQVEISGRSNFYLKEQVPLIWLLAGVEVMHELSQSYRDIIRRHRGNAFVLDRSAIQESMTRNRLVISCYLQGTDRQLEAPTLVELNELQYPTSGLPFFEDRLIKPLLTKLGSDRKPWFDYFKQWDHQSVRDGYSLGTTTLVAAAFSIVASANGQEKNYASGHANIKGMLNTYLHPISGRLSGYADLLKTLIQRTKVDYLLRPNETVGKHLAKYRSDAQADEGSEDWRLLQSLLPEALDPKTHELLASHSELPNWVKPEW